ERRRLELESASVPVNDPAMTRLLEQTAESGQPRQVCYALTLLAETPDYELNSLLEKLASSAAPQIRAKVYELSWFVVYDELIAACRSAGVMRNRACVESIIRRLADPRVRAVAIESLAAYGTSITGFLGDFLMDETVAPAIRRQIPRALKLVNDQRSVDVLLK